MKRIAIFALLLAALLLFGCAEPRVDMPAGETQTSEAPEPAAKKGLFDQLLAAPQCAMIGKTYADVERAYGPLSYVYVNPDTAIEFRFGTEAVAFLFEQVEIPDSWWTEETALTGYVPLDTAVHTLQATDVCTGVYGSFERLGVSDFDAFENGFSDADRAWSELYDSYLYARDYGRFSFISVCDSGADRLNTRDAVEIRLRVREPAQAAD